MLFKRSPIIVFGSLLMLSGCSYSYDALWPSLTGDEPAEAEAEAAAAAEPAEAAPPLAAQPAPPPPAPTTSSVVMASNQPPLGSTNFEPIQVTAGQQTGTFVGQKVTQMRGELEGLQGVLGAHNGNLQELRVRTIQDSQRYHGTVAAINARLQVGTTRGNPILVQQFNSAQVDLDRIGTDITDMNVLANKVAEDSNMISYLGQSVQSTFGLSGAIDEDHRQLEILQDETSQTQVLVERLLTELTEDVRRQTAYVASERGNMNTILAGIKSGELYGQSFSNRSFAVSERAAGVAQPPATFTGRSPLVVIRFDTADVQYKQPLYTAVTQVLERRPNATFDLVAVSSTVGGTAKAALNTGKARRHGEDVLRTLSEMGLPSNRVALSARSAGNIGHNEVHLYIR